MDPEKIEAHILKKYEVLKKLGSGAYGHVWKVKDIKTGKVYALKKIFDAFQHSTDAQRTYREITVLKQLNHTNIIGLHETIKAENDRDIYLLFEYMETDVHNVICEGLLQDVHKRYIIYQVLIALKYLHSA
jgi:mitogen-activated protein kinase 15